MTENVARAAIAASIAEGVTFPIDAAKTSVQLGRLKGVPPVRQLYRGASAAIARHIPYTSIRITIFHSLQDDLVGNSFPATMVSGLVAGAAGQFVAAPLDLIKIRMIADARSPSPRYSSLLDAFVKIGGEKRLSLWHGSGIAVQRAALVNLGELSTYSIAKQLLLDRGHPDTLSTHITSSLCSGAVSTLISNPADVVKSRMMNDPSLTSSIRVLRALWNEQGIRGLYRGSLHTYLRLAPWQLVFWSVFEATKEKNITLL